jgi:signal transduction histidine kinase
MDLADRMDTAADGLDGLSPAPPWALAFGDALAEWQPAPPRLCWATPAWQALAAHWPAPALADALTSTMTAVQTGMLRTRAAPAGGACTLPGTAQRAPLTLHWVPACTPDPAAQRLWLRLSPAPRHASAGAEAGADTRPDAAAATDAARAMHRHLQDRERLLFTSRSISIGEMASTLAHEVNQPIGTVGNVLRGIAARLQQLPVEGEAAEQMAERVAELQQGVRLALDQALFAGRVIGRIREFTHARQPRRERLDLAALARDSVALLDWEFARHGVPVTLDAPGPAWVRGDAVMLQQVIVNLLRNALDAQRAAGPPAGRCVALHLRRTDGGHELAIVDRGGGISREAEDQLFVPFVSSKPDGMGLGLKICRSFIELHQGRLWFTRNDAAEGGGCTFHIALDAATDVSPETIAHTAHDHVHDHAPGHAGGPAAAAAAPPR